MTSVPSSLYRGGAWAACARLPQLAFTPYCVVIRPIEFM